jgi:hypothetical protein
MFAMATAVIGRLLHVMPEWARGQFSFIAALLRRT